MILHEVKICKIELVKSSAARNVSSEQGVCGLKDSCCTIEHEKGDGQQQRDCRTGPNRNSGNRSMRQASLLKFGPCLACGNSVDGFLMRISPSEILDIRRGYAWICSIRTRYGVTGCLVCNRGSIPDLV